MARPISRSEFARTAGVSPAAITKACKGPLGAAALPNGRIDLDHVAAIAYLKSKGKEAPTTKATATRPRAPSKPTAPRPPRQEREEPDGADRPHTDTLKRPHEVTGEDIEKQAHRSLDDLVAEFGTAIVFKDWLDARKKISEIREKDLKNDETEGRLIERELVRTHVFGAIDASNRQLLGDAPTTIVRRIYAMAKSGEPVEEAEKVVREIIASQLRPVKAKAARVLRDA